MGLIVVMAAKKRQSAADKGKSAAKNAQALKKGALPGGKSKAKTKKKSWTKVKVKDKLNNDVFLDKKRFEKLMQEIPKILCVTRAVLIEKFKVNGSVARALISDSREKGLIAAI